jgi:general secretion pathway protein L
METSSTSLQPFLSAIRSRGREFLGWWLRELGAMVPLRLRQWWRGTSRMTVLILDATHAEFCRPTGQGLDSLLRVDLGPSGPGLGPEVVQPLLSKAIGQDFQILLGLAEDQALRRTLTLPGTLAENLRQTLGFELDRYTPFRPDQAYFDFRSMPVPGDGKAIRVELAAIPRETIDRPVAELARQNLHVSGAVLVRDFENPGNGLMNFLPASSFTRRPSGQTKRRVAFAALALTLLLAVLIIPLWQKRMVAVALIGPVARAQAAAKETDALREKLSARVDAYNFVFDKKWAGYSATRVLEELTKLLPDDTYLVGFDFDGQTVQIQGETASSVNMVETLEASPLFKDVAYKSPLTKIQGTPFDRFHIGTALEGAGQPPPPASPRAVAEKPTETPGQAAGSGISTVKP